MANIENYDVLVLGSGAAGKFVGWTMAKAGRRTAVVERKWLGGACPNIACLPSKNVIYSARVASLANRGAEFGVKFDSIKIDMATVQRRKSEMVEGLVRMHADNFKASGTEVIMGTGKFIGPRTLEVALNEGGTRQIRGEQVFIDTGSRASIPAVPGMSDARPMTHIELLDLDRLPKHLVVVGGGYIGLELSQAMRRFGSQVTIIEEGPQLAAREDEDIGAALLSLFKDEGVEVLLNSKIQRVEGQSGRSVQINVLQEGRERILEGTDILIAAGRTPNNDGIGLEKTGVDLDGRGFVKVNDRLETTAPNIWAMGDCAGSPQFTHVAVDDFMIVNQNLNGGSRTTKNRLIPFCMFTDPELARVGRNEREAKRDGIEYRIATMPMGEILRTRTISEPRGLIKVLVGKRSDEIIGFTALGFEASELMTAVQVAMIGKLPYTAIRDAIFTHPTMSEGLGELFAKIPA